MENFLGKPAIARWKLFRKCLCYCDLISKNEINNNNTRIINMIQYIETASNINIGINDTSTKIVHEPRRVSKYVRLERLHTNVFFHWSYLTRRDGQCW